MNYQEYIETLQNGLTVDASLPQQAERLKGTILNHDLTLFKGVYQSLKKDIEEANQSSTTAAAQIPKLTRQMHQLDELGKALYQIKSQDTPVALENVKNQMFAFCEQVMTLAEIEKALTLASGFLNESKKQLQHEDLSVWWQQFDKDTRQFLRIAFNIIDKRPSVATLEKCREDLAQGILFKKGKLPLVLDAQTHTPFSIFLPQDHQSKYKEATFKNYRDLNLTDLASFKNLQSLSIQGCSHTDWQSLKRLPVNTLSVKNCDGFALEELKGLDLRFLTIFNTPFIGLAQVNKFVRLNHLFVSYDALSPVEWANAFLHRSVHIGLFVPLQVLNQNFGTLGDILIRKWQQAKQDRFIPASSALWQLSNVFVSPYFLSHLPIALHNFLQNNPNVQLNLYVEESLLYIKSHTYVK